ncbi:MAG: response regulator transcription factor [Anaerolineae bacterium]|jgi:DNA-binding NarL/FixJ family response regulator
MVECVRVVIADDHAKARKGLRALLATAKMVEVVGEARDGQEAAQLVAECQPDVVLMDVRMPIWNGIEATRYIKARWPEIRVVALTIRAAWQQDALSAGADAFLIKGCAGRELLAAVLDSGPAGDQDQGVTGPAGAQADGQGNAESSQRLRLAPASLGS